MPVDRADWPPQATQTAIQPRARDLWVQKLLYHSEQVVNRHQQRAAQGHHHRLLSQGQSGLQPVRRVTVIMDAVAMPSFVEGLLSRSEPFGQGRRRIVTRLNRSPHLRRGRTLLVKVDQHGRTPFRMSLRTDLAMKNAERRESMLYKVQRNLRNHSAF